MTTATVKNWFYTQEPVEIDGTDGNPVCAYQNLPHRIPRPENEEDQIVLSFLNSTGRPEFDGRNIENYLRIALRRAAEAAVRATLDAEGQGVVYETANNPAPDTSVRTVRLPLMPAGYQYPANNMESAIVTASGAEYLGCDWLEGKTIQYKKICKTGRCIDLIFYRGYCTAMMLTIGGDTPNAILCNPAEQEKAKAFSAAYDEMTRAVNSERKKYQAQKAGKAATQPATFFSCTQTIYGLRHACLILNWRKAKAVIAWATKNNAQITAEVVSGTVRMTAKQGNANASDVIVCPDPRDATQIIESLRACGVTIKEAVAA